MRIFARVRKTKIVVISGSKYYVLPEDVIEQGDACIIFSWATGNTTMFSGVVDMDN
jgi:hypothetical protein